MEEQYIEDLKKKISDMTARCRICMSCYADCPLQLSTTGFVTQGPTGITKALYYGTLWNTLDGKDAEDIRDIAYMCTTCGGCVNRCKKSSCAIEVIDIIEAGRRLLVEKMIGPVPEQRSALESIYKYGNPYGEAPEKRLDWLTDSDVKRLPDDRAEILLYIGCTTSYEPGLHDVARSLVGIFKAMDLDFGLLEGEVCCGDPASTIGDEFLFEEMQTRNVEQFTAAGVSTIVTVSPHCFNAFRKKYEGLTDTCEVVHYTEFLAKCFEQKAPSFVKDIPCTATYHDPCYLGKHNDIYQVPRDLIKKIPGVRLVEMEMTGPNSLCCGGGGGRMYAEVKEEQRLADIRVGQAREVAADIIVTACPWCHTMIQNAVLDLQLENDIQVRDIAELLSESLGLEG